MEFRIVMKQLEVFVFLTQNSIDRWCVVHEESLERSNWGVVVVGIEKNCSGSAYIDCYVSGLL